MLYISGKISNLDPYIERQNLKRFFEVEKKLNKLGFRTFNPAKLEKEGGTWEYYLAKDLRWIVENKPSLYVMRGWEDSTGSRLEVELAKQMGLTIHYES